MRADPNGVPWTTGGPCFYDPRHAGEGCDAWYAQVGKGLSMFHTNVTRHRTARTDRRYGMYTEYSVYDFDAPFHDPAFPPSYAFLGSNYHRINAITEPAALKPRIAAWPLTNHTVVHAFHGKLWGSWQYTMAGGGVREGVIHFGRGGWQEAQDATDAETMGHWYIDGWAAALDIPGEWWFEGDTLYVFPNSTGALPHSVVGGSQRFRGACAGQRRACGECVGDTCGGNVLAVLRGPQRAVTGQCTAAQRSTLRMPPAPRWLGATCTTATATH